MEGYKKAYENVNFRYFETVKQHKELVDFLSDGCKLNNCVSYYVPYVLGLAEGRGIKRIRFMNANSEILKAVKAFGWEVEKWEGDTVLVKIRITRKNCR